MIFNASAVKAINAAYENYLSTYDSLVKTRSEQDFMAGDTYFDVGKSAIGAIATALISSGIESPKTILDLACGNGRVTRHLKLMFPEASITACDLYPEMVSFCEATFNVEGIVSKEDFATLDFGKTFDLIWCGSMLTHCNATLFREALICMCRALSVPGVAVATVHGRRAVCLQRYHWKMSPEAAFRPAERDFYRSGFGYITTSEAETRDHFPRNVALGIGNSLSSMSYVTGLVAEMEDAQLVFYREMGWNGHQDVVAFAKPGVF